MNADSAPDGCQLSWAESAWSLLPSTTTITIYYYYSARKLMHI